MSDIYIGSDGKVHEVKKMNDNHLINAFRSLKTKQRELMKAPFQHKQAVLTKIGQDLVKISDEIKKRGLFDVIKNT